MADTYTANIVVEHVTFPSSQNSLQVAFKSGKSHLMLPVRAGGIVGPVVAGTSASQTRWCRTTASDISGYRKLLSSNNSTSTVYNASVFLDTGVEGFTSIIEEFATDAGDMDDRHADNENDTFRVRAYWSGITTPQEAQIEGQIYYRAADGTEVLIQTILRDITSTATTYVITTVPLYRSWYTNDRLVTKWRGRFIGGPPV